MSTERQINANRANAKKSTGPRTAEGKSLSKMNAAKHGLSAQGVLLSEEDRGEFEELRGRLWEARAPVGIYEELLLERVLYNEWRWRRFGRLEGSILEY